MARKTKVKIDVVLLEEQRKTLENKISGYKAVKDYPDPSFLKKVVDRLEHDLGNVLFAISLSTGRF